jgi:hypothetical protein
MNRPASFFLTVALLFSACVTSAFAAKNVQQKPNTEQIEVIGEVVDSWCYASKSVGTGRGAEHKKCAETCILGGVSAGILDDKGNLYIAAKSRAYQGANRMLLPFTAKKVLVKGWVSRAGGSQLLKIDSVEEWKPGMKVGVKRASAAPAPGSKEITDAAVKELIEQAKQSKTEFPTRNKTKTKGQ